MLKFVHEFVLCYVWKCPTAWTPTLNLNVATPSLSNCRYNWFPNDAHRMSGFGVPPATRAGGGGDRRGHDWGGGNRLGD